MARTSQSRLNKQFLDFAWPKFNKCQWCLVPLLRIECTTDHIYPRSRGGSNAWSNLLVSCLDCNNRRRNKCVTNRRGIWIAEDVAKPHGPVWSGPTWQRGVKSYWCDCHRGVFIVQPGAAS